MFLIPSILSKCKLSITLFLHLTSFLPLNAHFSIYIQTLIELSVSGNGLCASYRQDLCTHKAYILEDGANNKQEITENDGF